MIEKLICIIISATSQIRNHNCRSFQAKAKKKTAFLAFEGHSYLVVDPEDVGDVDADLDHVDRVREGQLEL